MGLGDELDRNEIRRNRGYNLSGHPKKDRMWKWISDVQSELTVLSDGVASASPQGVTSVSDSLSDVSSNQIVVSDALKTASDALSDLTSDLTLVSDSTLTLPKGLNRDTLGNPGNH